MKAAIVVNNASHQAQHAGWIKEGLEKHGWACDLVRSGHKVQRYDMVVSWSIKHRSVWEWQKREGGPALIMERAALQPRDQWTGCGFNGLAGKAIYPRSTDGGDRWRRNFGHLEKPWRAGGDYALLCGQCVGDAALWGCDFRRWAQTQANDLKARGWDVRYRPHPFAYKHGDRWCPNGATLSLRPYGADLAGAALVVTYNSTAGVEAVLDGVPTVAMDNGAMAWAVTTHNLDDAPIRPDRSPWAHDLAWSCWLPGELRNGDAWDVLKTVVPNLEVRPEPPDIVSKVRHGRRVLVLGGAACLWDDVERALALAEFDAVVACNEAAASWPGELDALVTLHPSKLSRWLKQRRTDTKAPAPGEIVSFKAGNGITRVVDYRWAGASTSGSSGLYTAKVALEMGFERAVLCGIPVTQEPHFFDGRPWRDAPKFRSAWKFALPHLRDNVRSMSGWTSELLGVPTAEWLAS